MAIEPLHMDSKLSQGFTGSGVSEKVKEKVTEELVKEGKLTKAKYRIELVFSKHRSSAMHKPSPFALVIWESGKRLHGGGDQKMYWCGYNDCAKPLSSDNFAGFHVVCPSCKRELFLDSDSRMEHVKLLKKEGTPLNDIEKIPTVVGEYMFNLTPPDTASLIVRTWRSLGGDADVYLKWSPKEIRYDSLHATNKTIDSLTGVRLKRQPVMYTLKRIVDDLTAGADLKKRFLSFLTS
jgi:hypothetical protein